MRKFLLILGLMSIGLTHAQQGRNHTQHDTAKNRVGVNTEKPVASLEISKLANIPAGQVEGFLLPHLDQAERNAMEKLALVNGIMIFNTTKNCIDWWDGTHWQCIDGSDKDEHGSTKYFSTKSYNGNASFTRNNCPTGFVGSAVRYSATTTGTATSTISQADADKKANDLAVLQFNKDGQNYANTNGTCSQIITYTSTKSYTGTAYFIKNNCSAGYVGQRVYYSNTVTETATSTVSQADADEKAQLAARQRFDQNGQAYANEQGRCVFEHPKECIIHYSWTARTSPLKFDSGVWTTKIEGSGSYYKTLYEDDDRIGLYHEVRNRAESEASQAAHNRFGHGGYFNFNYEINSESDDCRGN